MAQTKGALVQEVMKPNELTLELRNFMMLLKEPSSFFSSPISPSQDGSMFGPMEPLLLDIIITPLSLSIWTIPGGKEFSLDKVQVGRGGGAQKGTPEIKGGGEGSQGHLDIVQNKGLSPPGTFPYLSSDIQFSSSLFLLTLFSALNSSSWLW